MARPQTNQYGPWGSYNGGRGFRLSEDEQTAIQTLRGQRATGKYRGASKGFWEGQPELTGISSGFDRSKYNFRDIPRGDTQSRAWKTAKKSAGSVRDWAKDTDWGVGARSGGFTFERGWQDPENPPGPIARARPALATHRVLGAGQQSAGAIPQGGVRIMGELEPAKRTAMGSRNPREFVGTPEGQVQEGRFLPGTHPILPYPAAIDTTLAGEPRKRGARMGAFTQIRSDLGPHRTV